MHYCTEHVRGEKEGGSPQYREQGNRILSCLLPWRAGEQARGVPGEASGIGDYARAVPIPQIIYIRSKYLHL